MPSVRWDENYDEYTMSGLLCPTRDSALTMAGFRYIGGGLWEFDRPPKVAVRCERCGQQIVGATALSERNIHRFKRDCLVSLVSRISEIGTQEEPLADSIPNLSTNSVNGGAA